MAARVAATVLIASVMVSIGAAQSPPAVRRPRPRPSVTRVIVRDMSGTPLDGVQVTIDGVGGVHPTTDAQGVASVTLADGSHRLRLVRDGFITLEREVTIRSGLPEEITAALNAAPLPPTPPPPPPPPAPPAPSAPVASGPPSNVSITAFLDKNFIGREPIKESILGCTPGAATRLLQLRDPLASHTHDDLDEILYVVAGDGALRVGEDVVVVTPGSLSVIPRGLPHAIERRGKNPLILLSTLAGAPCRGLASAQLSRK